MAEIEAEAIRLRVLASNARALFNRLPARRQRFDLSGDSSTTDFKPGYGWKPDLVFVAGSLFREGAGEDYTVTYDGSEYTVVMAVAPAVVDVTIIAELEV
jgi:hypothetical protein